MSKPLRINQKGKVASIRRGLKNFSSKKVIIGFLKGKADVPRNTDDDEDLTTNLDVALANHFGTRKKGKVHIPARPFVDVSIREKSRYFGKKFSDATKKILKGNLNVDDFLDKMGEQGITVMQDYAINLRTPENAASTIAQKKSSNPLINNGDMVRAVSYEIRDE